MTTVVSAGIHVLVLGFAIGLPILYASDALPEPPDMMAFVVDAPPPPPPPPPPAPPPPEARKPEPAKPNAAEIPVARPEPRPANTVAAPIEAPAEVRPETGNEGAMATAKTAAVEAGFERGVSGGIEGGVAGGVVTAEAPPPPPPPAPPKPSGPVRVGGKVKAPSLVNRVNPEYPAVAQSAQVEGAVVLEATVGKDGRVDSVRIVNGNPLLNASAIAAVKQWRYEPLQLNGDPVPFILTVTVSFRMPR
jgi:protein TonB